MEETSSYRFDQLAKGTAKPKIIHTHAKNLGNFGIWYSRKHSILAERVKGCKDVENR